MKIHVFLNYLHAYGCYKLMGVSFKDIYASYFFTYLLLSLHLGQVILYYLESYPLPPH